MLQSRRVWQMLDLTDVRRPRLSSSPPLALCPCQSQIFRSVSHSLLSQPSHMGFRVAAWSFKHFSPTKTESSSSPKNNWKTHSIRFIKMTLWCDKKRQTWMNKADDNRMSHKTCKSKLYKYFSKKELALWALQAHSKAGGPDHCQSVTLTLEQLQGCGRLSGTGRYHNSVAHQNYDLVL